MWWDSRVWDRNERDPGPGVPPRTRSVGPTRVDEPYYSFEPHVPTHSYSTEDRPPPEEPVGSGTMNSGILTNVSKGFPGYPGVRSTLDQE